MKKIYTLLFAICISSSLSAQQVSIGVDGNDMYYKTEANIYLAALKLGLRQLYTLHFVYLLSKLFMEG